MYSDLFEHTIKKNLASTQVTHGWADSSTMAIKQLKRIITAIILVIIY